MSERFEIVKELEIAASPQEVWDAITTGTAGWLWPMEYEPKEGGAAPFGGTVTVWEPPHRLTARTEDAAGISQQTFNQLEHVIEPLEGGGCRLRYVHSGIFVDDWANQYDGADKHNDFYLHTLREYVTHFTGRQAVFATADGPAAAGAPDALDTAAHALGLAPGTAVGETVTVTLPGASAPAAAVLDYRNPYFIGLRTQDAMYRVFGRNRFGATVGLSIHDFALGAERGAGSEAASAALTRDAESWLAAVYG
ncbi:SRPBCC domain-containing protein [Streptomyces sp. NPDC087270]|uniref:SRPBCC family protein n=1 Tax=Streptomyces sp. NPDC087270 TaxID=3365774 RepID=UPI003826F111